MAFRALPRASAAKCTYHLKQLRKFFARADDRAFLEMIWAADALQSDREHAAKPFISFYPREAVADSSINTSMGIHRWELETLLVQLLLTPKQERRLEGNAILDCSKFESIRQAINRLRALENVETAAYMHGEFNVFNEMYRIAQRQFHWQRGYFNTPQFYRYTYVYAQGKCAEYFQRTYGFSITDFIFTAVGLFAANQMSPWVPWHTAVPEIGLTEELVQLALPIMSSSIEKARMDTVTLVEEANKAHGKPVPTALLPSVLRKSPFVSIDNNPNLLIAPIVELLLARVTSGLYYDLIGGGQALLNEANDRFEQYCKDLISAMMPRFDVSRSYSYGPKGLLVDTPDLLIKDNGKIVIAGECKATKLTYLAQFSEDPFESGKKTYIQIAKGIFQLWRFFSHVRRGILQAELDRDAHAMVLTMDAFLTLGRGPHNKVLIEANKLADEEGDIIAEDRKPVIICPIYDLEAIFATATEDSFLISLEASYEEVKEGWALRDVHRETKASREFGQPNKFPFDLNALLPWWNRAREMEAAKAQNGMA